MPDRLSRAMDFEDRLGRGEFVEADQLEEMHQGAVNAWDDASHERSGWNMEVDVADQSRLTQEVRYWRALHRGETPPEMKKAEPLEALSPTYSDETLETIRASGALQQ